MGHLLAEDIKGKRCPWRMERDEKEMALEREEQNESERDLLQSYSWMECP